MPLRFYRLGIASLACRDKSNLLLRHRHRQVEVAGNNKIEEQSFLGV